MSVLQVVPSPAGLNDAGRLANIFMAPSRSYADIRRNRNWWLPFLITAIVSYTFLATTVLRVGFERMVVNAITADPVAGRITEGNPDQQEATLRTAETTLEVSILATPVFILTYNAIYAFLLWGSLMLVGGEAEFGGIFTVLLYADLIQCVRPFLSMIVLFAKPDLSAFNIQNPVATNAGYFLDPAAANWLKVLLSAVDFVTLWYLVVIAIGCSIAARTKMKETFAIVFGWWITAVMIRVFWAALS